MVVNKRKKKWYAAEDLVSHYFRDQGFLLVEKNYTIRGWELDLIIKNNQTRLFVEVKCVDAIDDIIDHIGRQKLGVVKKTINWYFYEVDQGELDVQLALVYVKWDSIYQIFYYEN